VLYTLLSYVGFFLLLPVLFWHHKLKNGIAQRFGFKRTFLPFLKQQEQHKDRPVIWFHGASAGDLLALKPTVGAVKQLATETWPVLSTLTNSGHAMAQKIFSQEYCFYAPYDLLHTTQRVLQYLSPRILVLEYTELWPHLIIQAHQRNVKIVLHNGRLSSGNLNAYRLLFRLTGPLLSYFSLLLMKDEEEADRALRLGADPKRVIVSGNTKFDNIKIPKQQHSTRFLPLLQRLGWAPTDPIWILGSTHTQEEWPLYQGFLRLKKRWPQLRLIVAPRYVERAPMLAEQMSGCLFSLPQPGRSVLLLDVIGELADLYTLATLVFVGGSLCARGGQNILEPAICGKPVIFGPHIDNILDLVKVLLGRGGIQAAHAAQVISVTESLLERKDMIDKLGDMARAAVLSKQGASAHNARLIVDLLA